MRRANRIGAGRRLAVVLALLAAAPVFLLLAPRRDPMRSAGGRDASAVTGDSHSAAPTAAAAAPVVPKREPEVESPTESRPASQASTNLDFVAHAAALGVALTPWPEIEGAVVRADDGTPIAGAKVEVTYFNCSGTIAPGEAAIEGLRGTEALRGTTDASGRFRVRTGAGVLITVRSPGLGVEAATVEQPVTDATAVHLFKMRRAMTLGGRVVDAEGAPVAGAKVQAIGLQKTGGYRFWGSFCGNPYVEWRFDLGKTNDDGTFEAVECYAAGRVTLRIVRDEQCVCFPTVSIAADDAPEKRIELRLPPTCRLVGTVRHADGSPSPDVRIVVERQFDAWGNADFDTHTGESGEFELVLGAPGLYRVRLVSDGDAGTPIELLSADEQLPAGVTAHQWTDPRPATPPGTREDGDDERESLPERPRGSVQGQVVVAATADEPPPCKILLLRDGLVIEEESAADNGVFCFDAVEAGSYTAMALCGGHRRFECTPFEVADDRPVSLSPWTLQRAGSIRGRVVDTRGRGVAEARVAIAAEVVRAETILRQPRCEVASATTDAEGRFTLGALDVAAVLEVDVPGLPGRLLPLARDAARWEKELVIAVPATRSVRGRVVVPGGLPDANLLFRCQAAVPPERLDEYVGVLDPTETVCEVDVKPDGTFEAQRIPTSTCDVALWFNSSSWDSLGCTVARRHLAAGDRDVELGDWVLPSEAR